MGTDICDVPSLHVHLDHRPVLGVLPQRFQEALVLLRGPPADPLALIIEFDW